VNQKSTKTKIEGSPFQLKIKKYTKVPSTFITYPTIFIMPAQPRMPPIEFVGLETVYFLVIFLACFLIYRKVREVYRLTDYFGFHLFANIFLFLGLAYFMRFVVVILLASGVVFDSKPLEDIREIMSFSIAFLAYTSSVSILYAIYSLLWSRMVTHFGEVVIHIISLLAGFSILLFRFLPAFLIFQFLLILILLIAILVNYRYYSSGKIRKVYPVYLLLFIFWLLNFSLAFGLLREFKFFIYGLSVVVIFIICYEVLRRL
jgi:hypothetical protein